MLHKVTRGRKILVFGRESFKILHTIAHLKIGGVDVSDVIYHKLDDVENFGVQISDWNKYAFKSDANYIVVAEKENYEEIRALLIDNGYTPTEDFIKGYK